MSKFNIKDKRHVPTAVPIKSNPVSTVQTYNGAPGYEYDTLSQLFLLACANMVGEDTFYEGGKLRDARYNQLVRKAVDEGHAQWLGRFLPWLRDSANMRSAAIVGAAEAAIAMVTAGAPGGRQLVNDALARADEPGELLAYFTSNYGRAVPKPIKRGIADAAQRLYTERNTLKYDTASHGYRFGQILELVHATPATYEQGVLFKHLVTRGHGRTPLEIPSSLTMLHNNQKLREQAAKHPELLLNTSRLHAAGMTWEAAKSLVGGRVSDKDIWTALIPTMGYMALLRNLRNFDEAGVKGDMIAWVQLKLADPVEVAKSRQLPMRFLSAYNNVPSSRWAQPLEEGLNACLKTLPMFPGRTLILIDTSYSMNGKLSAKSQLQRWDAAAIFGVALAQRCHDATVVSFSSENKVFPQVKGESLLKGIERFRNGYFYGNNTATGLAVRQNYGGHDRVICLTDEQANSDGWAVFAPVPADKMVITFNLAGYAQGHAPAGTKTRVTIGGLSDAAWQLLPALEGRAQGLWPF